MRKTSGEQVLVELASGTKPGKSRFMWPANPKDDRPIHRLFSSKILYRFFFVSLLLLWCNTWESQLLGLVKTFLSASSFRRVCVGRIISDQVGRTGAKLTRGEVTQFPMNKWWRGKPVDKEAICRPELARRKTSLECRWRGKTGALWETTFYRK